jgi:hypothetical protein
MGHSFGARCHCAVDHDEQERFMVGAMQALLLAYSSLPTWYARRWPAAPNLRAPQLLIGTSCMLLGFETGYNLTAPRTFDPFAKWATIHLIAHSLDQRLVSEEYEQGLRQRNSRFGSEASRMTGAIGAPKAHVAVRTLALTIRRGEITHYELA